MAYFYCFLYQLEVPLLSARQARMSGACYQTRPDSPTKERSAEESDGEAGQEFTYRDELLNRMYKFMGVIETTLQDLQIQGVVIKKRCYLLTGYHWEIYFDCVVAAKQSKQNLWFGIFLLQTK